ncbi:MAG: PEP-CTERM system TPR-repeat protein PrsT [Rhodanobacteraceae bacterium]|nr:MAG: PEP-CTERM system TPR-repeat protein PrsT [Rhodanobacteraceae bacterium]
MRSIESNQRGVRRVLTLLCLGLLLTGCGLASRNGSVAAGEKYQASGKYRAAYIEAKKVLQRDDKNGEAWLLLGKASLMLGEPKDALSDLDKARAAGVPEARWAVPMGEALLVTQQFDKVLQTLSPDTPFEPGVKARVDVLRGNAQRGLRQPDQARQSYEAALRLEPRDPRALVGLSRLASDAKDTATADRYIQQALAASSENPQAWVAKADLAFESGDAPGAESDYEKVLGFKNPDWLPQDAFYAQVRLADAQVRQKKYDQALANIGMLEKMSPGQPYTHYLHAVVLYEQRHLDDAVSQLQLVLRASPDNVPAQMLMGAVNYAQGNYGQAEMYLSNVMGVDQQNVPARKLLALTFYRQGRSQKALSTLRPTAPANASDAELLALLQRAAAEGAGLPPGHAGSSGAASSLSSQAAAGGAGTPAVVTTMSGAGRPQNPELARAADALANGNPAEAVRLLKAMPASDSTTRTQRTTMLVMAYVRAGQTDQAVRTAADNAARHPDDSAAHLLYGTALVAAGKHDEARAQYNEAMKLDPKNVAALMSLGSLDSIERHYPDAERLYQKALDKDPRNVEVMAALGKLAAAQGDKAGAIERFKQAIAASPKSAAAYIDLVMLYSEGGQFEDAAATAKQLADALPDNPAALNAFGAAELNAGHHDVAMQPLQQAVKLAPTVALYRINLARAQILGKDTKGAQDNLAEVIKADPGQVQAVALLAFMKLQDHDQQGAVALAQSLQKQPATRVAGFTLEGDLYMAGKAYAKAADAYQQGLKIQYDRPLVVKSFLAQSANGAKNPEGVLEAWLAKHSDDAAMRLMLAQYYLDHVQNAQAIEQYEGVLKAYPSNIDALNNLAWIYTEQKNPKALALAARAHKLAPDSPGIQDTYAWALIEANQAKAALPLLQQANKAAPNVPAIQYHLAVAQARTGDKAGARGTLEALQKSGANFQGKSAANKLYQELGGGSGN